MSDKPDSQVFCPDCNERLQKCLIQQNYAIIICPSLVCGYPFNQREVLENLTYVDDNDVLKVAKKRLSSRSKP
ncbi:AQG_2a_G0045820.mRNA.1.CDS.1 [Saccharomyces cerevisiae]|uniref:K7_Ynl162w-ap n=5 Tax=Saccharomyces cerevisiae TaxID=4932 RepID=G2WLU4_YEASK|nr:hypothetical protein H779_YJM993N00163 [Saccharomyces cerevisiae YJM993]AJP41173.1 hypothetical protein F842_YJM1078N00162 [Saccharomyces cerevisiae YJM1078]AJT01610.1 hypothetical protein H747_YJM189N00162 [Saccharomyces cerevisiae YJM189]AJT01979.1 hypothetical protein H748_YJM193N00162 [Saccharomyces cerevisiae YJM193]AJT02354.1 hypothetical protein H749_YJM195N00161 [Saccharomyces cerevisiae YJM195]AJT02723.1 hypothetical protein H750_YJM244N00158 [Saccharomyces cerevisiae YJM244]AJT03